MPAFGRAARLAFKVAPIALEVARQVDQKVRPHVRAYNLARAVDGVVGSWTDQDGTHWVVFDEVDGRPLQAFPPLSEAQMALVATELDRGTLQHHSDLPEATVRDRIGRVGDRSSALAAKVRRRRR
jgi:hypothetical protein